MGGLLFRGKLLQPSAILLGPLFFFIKKKGTTRTHSTGFLQMVLRKATPTQIHITSKLKKKGKKQKNTFDRIPADFLYRNQHLPKFGPPMRPGTRTRVPRRHCLHLRSKRNRKELQTLNASMSIKLILEPRTNINIVQLLESGVSWFHLATGE